MSWFRRLPVFPGKMRLARFLFRDRLDQGDVPAEDRWGNRFLLPNIREPSAFHLFVEGVYEPATVTFLSRYLSAGSNFLDVGANIGLFTVPAAKRIGVKGTVLSIEPSPRIWPYLQRNTAENHLPNVRLKNCAASDQDGHPIPFYEAPTRSFGMGACGPRFQTPTISVPGRTVDSLLEEERLTSVDVMKIDVEGYEWSVLRGTERLLTGPKPPLVIFEFLDWGESQMPGRQAGDAQRLLREYGYHLWRLSDFLNGRWEFQGILEKGFEMLVAAKPGSPS